MNRKQFFILIIAGLIVGGLGLYFASKRRDSYSASSFDSEQRVLKDFPLNEVAHIRIQQASNEVNLARGETWTVKERWDYPANYSDIHQLLTKTWELKPVQDVEAGPSQYGRLQLTSPAENAGTNSGTLVEFKDAKAENLKSLILGKQHMRESPGGGPFGGGGYPVGRYLLVPETKKVWLVNETFSNVQTEPENWLNKDFIKVEKIKSVSVTSPSSTNSWNLSRETESGEWRMADLNEGENFDASRATSLNYVLSSPSFNDVASPEAQAEEIGMAQPTVARLETFDGFLYTVNIGSKTNEDSNVYLKVDVEANFTTERNAPADESAEDKERLDKEFKEKTEKLQEKLKNEQRFEKWTYLVSKWTVDTLLKPRSDFMAAPKTEDTEDAAHSDDDGHDHDEPAATPPFETVPKLDAPLPPLPEDE